MHDEEREKRILFLLKVWFYITENHLVWPKVKNWIEEKLNEELE